jgi:hypothetical protein
VISRAQTRALDQVKRRAEAARGDARARIAAALARSGEGEQASRAIERHLRERARVTLNFHPDRVGAEGHTVVEGLLAEGQYRSQFVTGISNGSRTAFAGGDRDRWEQTLFEGAYHDGPAPADERPKYGGLDVMGHADGACPRFGSCYFELRPHVLSRCTFTWGDSHAGPEHVGTIEVVEPLIAALLESVAATGEALGVAGLDVASLAARLAGGLDAAPRPVGRALDAYIEAQIHGEIDLSRDVAALIVDPAFEATPTGEQLRALAAKHGLALSSHPGFVLAPAEVPADFRGPRMVPLAGRLDERFARQRGELDAAVIGRAARDLHDDPASWGDWAPAEDALQHLKQIWHVLVRFGRARPAAGR